jgi:hypothetical protein
MSSFVKLLDKGRAINSGMVRRPSTTSTIHLAENFPPQSKTKPVLVVCIVDSIQLRGMGTRQLSGQMGLVPHEGHLFGLCQLSSFPEQLLHHPSGALSSV